jgi:PAS domain S-box-containing protein
MDQLGDGISPMSNNSGKQHPRTIGWFGTTALAMGGSNQSLFLIAGAGGLIATQGSAAIPLLALGLILSWLAAPGWTELILMWPNRVGGIAATCAEAFRPYSRVLAVLTGTCYWWGWIPTCGLTAILSACALHQWYLPHVPINLIAIGIISLFTAVNLSGVKSVVRLAIPIAIGSAILAFMSAVIPVLTGHEDWHRATTFHLVTPFGGFFGKVTSAMAGLYLIGFAAPAFEAAACHVGETIDPAKNVPKAMLASALMAGLYFVILPFVWLGFFGTAPLLNDLQNVLGPTFAPFAGPLAKSAAIWFMTLNMFQGTLQPLAGASRTISQLADDGLLPKILAMRSKTDCPWVATLLTAGFAIIFLLTGDPTWVIAAANLTYLIGIGMPNIAVWLLRRNAPDLPRPYRAPDWTITAGVVAASIWGLSTLLGFEQFGLPTVLAGIALAYSGVAINGVQWLFERRGAGLRPLFNSLHSKLTGAMLLVLALDGGGYLLAIDHVSQSRPALIAGLQDIFVAVALLTISVGLILPGMIAHAAEEISIAARRLATGTLADFSRAMEALGAGRLEDAHARIDVIAVNVLTNDEMSEMAASFNLMQTEIASAAGGLDNAREGLRIAQAELVESNQRFAVAVEGSMDGLWDWDITNNRVYFSPRWKSMLGYLDHELTNQVETWLNLLHLDDLVTVKKHIDDYLSGAISAFEIQYRMIHKDGRQLWILARGAALRDGNGVPYRLAGSHSDITERKAEEDERLRLATNNLLLLESTSEGIYGIDLDGICTFVNEAAARTLGYSRDEMVGQNVHTLSHHSHQDGSHYSIKDCPIYNALHSTGRCHVDTEVFWRKDGSSISVEYSSSPIIDNGKVTGAVVCLADITERKLEREELVQAKLTAELANRSKSQFLANMSHELRTPLNAILGFSELLLDQHFGALNPKQIKYLGHTLTSGKHLLELINNILDHSKIEAGRVDLIKTELDVSVILNAAISIIRPLASKKSIELTVDVEPNVPALYADDAHMRQVLLNLLSNAVKFTREHGRIEVHAEMAAEQLLISVKDEGIGIAPEDIERIWKEFEQTDSSYSREQQGTGLGLSITKRLVQLHGGSAWAESLGVGHGSTFYVSLPIRAEDESAIPEIRLAA